MYEIALIPGDGIGPEVTEETRRVLDRAAEQFGFQINWTEYPFGADHYLATGDLLPDDQFRELKDFDSIYLGAIGDPRVEPGHLEMGIVGKIRFDLDLYVNLRPIRLYNSRLCPIKDLSPDDLDLLVVRENTEDVYTGIGGELKKDTPDEVAMQQMIYTRKGTERIIRYAFERAQERDGFLTLVDKYNAVQAHGIYRRTLEDVKDDYPDVDTDHAYVDAMAMWMVKDPSYYDTIVTTNMFGDIITDLGAMIQGGLGIAAGGNIHPGKHAMFEPIHGSAPKHAGDDVASPIAAILSGGMMLSFLGEDDAADAVESAVEDVLSSPEVTSVSTSSDISTREMSDHVIDAL